MATLFIVLFVILLTYQAAERIGGKQLGDYHV
jgi:hypothetical protein